MSALCKYKQLIIMQAGIEISEALAALGYFKLRVHG